MEQEDIPQLPELRPETGQTLVPLSNFHEEKPPLSVWLVAASVLGFLELVLPLVGTIKIVRWIARFRREQLWAAEEKNTARRFFYIGVRLAFIVCFLPLNILMVSWIVKFPWG